MLSKSLIVNQFLRKLISWRSCPMLILTLELQVCFHVDYAYISEKV